MDDNQTDANVLQVGIQVSSGLPECVQVKYVVFFFFWSGGWLIDLIFY